jgi:hypothetical protein
MTESLSERRSTFGSPGCPDEEDWQAGSLPDLPLWSENFFFGSWDADAGLGVWTHLGRMPHDPTLWREIVFLFLPDGSILIGKQYGRAEGPRGPGASSLSFSCIEPWNEWRVQFDGCLVRTTFNRLDRAFLSEGEFIPAVVDLEWHPISPVWDISRDMERQSWGDIHHEQLGGLSGTVSYEGHEVAFSGVGLRDHTRGPRSWRPFVRHCWLHGVFGNDSGFMVANMELDDHHLQRAAVFENGRIVEVDLPRAPQLTTRRDGSSAYQLAFTGYQPIEAEILHNNVLAMATDNDILLGFDGDVVSHSAFEGFTRFTWGDKVGYGLTERSLRGTE